MNYQKSNGKKILSITEEPNDFNKKTSVVLYHGCCCCCCLWTVTGVIGGIIGYRSAKKNEEYLYARLPKIVRDGFVAGGWFASFVSLIIYYVVFSIVLDNDDPEKFRNINIAGAVFLPLLVIPFTIGGAIGARMGLSYYARHSKITRKDTPNMKPVWDILRSIWASTIACTVLGIVFFAAIIDLISRFR